VPALVVAAVVGDIVTSQGGFDSSEQTTAMLVLAGSIVVRMLQEVNFVSELAQTSGAKIVAVLAGVCVLLFLVAFWLSITGVNVLIAVLVMSPIFAATVWWAVPRIIRLRKTGR